MDAKLLRQLDVCRPDSADDQFPEMRDLAEGLAADEQLRAAQRQVQAIDRRIGSELRQGDVPAGLAERIMASLDAAHAATQKDRAKASGATMFRTFGIRPPRRRRWLMGAGVMAMACAAGLMGAWLLWPAQPIDLNAEAVMQLARDLIDEVRPDGGSLVSEKTPPAHFGVGQYVIAGARTRWRAFDRLLAGRDGVVYDLEGPREQRGRLFVVDLQGPLGSPTLHLLPRTPTQQVLTTSGYSSAAWTDGERLYVLIVPGDEKALQSFLRDAGAMA